MQLPYSIKWLPVLYKNDVSLDLTYNDQKRRHFEQYCSRLNALNIVYETWFTLFYRMYKLLLRMPHLTKHEFPKRTWRLFEAQFVIIQSNWSIFLASAIGLITVSFQATNDIIKRKKNIIPFCPPHSINSRQCYM